MIFWQSIWLFSICLVLLSHSFIPDLGMHGGLNKKCPKWFMYLNIGTLLGVLLREVMEVESCWIKCNTRSEYWDTIAPLYFLLGLYTSMCVVEMWWTTSYSGHLWSCLPFHYWSSQLWNHKLKLTLFTTLFLVIFRYRNMFFSFVNLTQFRVIWEEPQLRKCLYHIACR